MPRWARPPRLTELPPQRGQPDWRETSASRRRRTRCRSGGRTVDAIVDQLSALVGGIDAGSRCVPPALVGTSPWRCYVPALELAQPGDTHGPRPCRQERIRHRRAGASAASSSNDCWPKGCGWRSAPATPTASPRQPRHGRPRRSARRRCRRSRRLTAWVDDRPPTSVDSTCVVATTSAKGGIPPTIEGWRRSFDIDVLAPSP